MKGYVKRTFTQEEIDKINRVFTHYANLHDNFNPNNYIKEIKIKGLFGRIKIIKEFDKETMEAKYKNHWFHIQLGWSIPYLSTFDNWKNLQALILLLEQGSELYISEHIASAVHCALEEDV